MPNGAWVKGDALYDAIVIGARCAGSPTAMLLAQKGYRVLAVDRSTFPSDTMSTHVVGGDAVARLDKWGLLERVLATGVPQCTRPFTMIIDGQEHVWDFFPDDYPQIAPRRTYLDKILVDGAREAGAEVREGFSVRELLWEEGRVAGMRGVDADGIEVEERARLTIGADGKWSKVARWVEAELYNTLPGRGCFYYSYWTGVTGIDRMEFHISTGSGYVAFVFPTNDNQVCMGVGRPGADWTEFKRDPDSTVAAGFAALPSLAPHIGNRKQIERLQGLKMYESGYRKPFGPGWALVGDSAYLKDPTLGQGINDCFRDAEYLSDAIHAGFSGSAPLEEALAVYQRRRDEETAGIYQLNDLMAQGPTAEKVAIARQAITSMLEQQAPAAAAG